MDWFETLKTRVARIQRYARVALVCQCAERCRPLYEALREDPDDRAFVDAVECGWRFAERGQREANRVQDLRRRVGELVEYYLDMDYQLLANAVTVSLRVLQAIDDDEDASSLATARALATTLDVADQTEAATVMPPAPVSGAFEEEEKAWQAAAIQIAEQWRGFAITSMFASVSLPEGPRWLSQFLAARTQR